MIEDYLSDREIARLLRWVRLYRRIRAWLPFAPTREADWTCRKCRTLVCSRERRWWTLGIYETGVCPACNEETQFISARMFPAYKQQAIKHAQEAR